jgi:ATPase subunit of ABC transporter with duplicated ATPase domains
MMLQQDGNSAQLNDADPIIDTETNSDLFHSSSVKYAQEVDKLKMSDLQEHILVAKRLSKTYDCTLGRKKALQSFSIKLSKDKIFGLLGPNGAGKTTFL